MLKQVSYLPSVPSPSSGQHDCHRFVLGGLRTSPSSLRNHPGRSGGKAMAGMRSLDSRPQRPAGAARQGLGNADCRRHRRVRDTAPESPGAPLPEAAAARRPRPDPATRGEGAAGLSHGAEEGPAVWPKGPRMSLSSPPASRRSRPPGRVRGDHLPRRRSIAAAAAIPKDAAAAAAAASAAGNRPHPFLPLSRKKNLGKMLRESALQKKITCCRQRALLGARLLPFPSSLRSGGSSLLRS